MKNYETMIVGCGAMGSSISYHLSKRGVKTLTLEKFELNHKNGSSHGDSRQTTAVYFTHSTLISLVKRAVELWLQLEKDAGMKLLDLNGMLILGSRRTPSDELRIRIGEAMNKGNSSFRLLSASEIREAFPVFQPNEKDEGVYEPGGGTLFPENCIQSYVNLAKNNGAEFHFNEPLLSWRRENDGKIVVRTNKESYSAEKVVFSAGGWLTQLVPDLRLPLTCERQIVLRFKPIHKVESFAPNKMPGFIWLQDDLSFFYGVPDFGVGVKIGRHHGGEIVSSPEEIRREVTSQDEAEVRNFIVKHMPSANGPLLYSGTCLYTNTPDHNYLIDFHPNARNIILVSPCSGEGFHTSSAIGEMVADLVTVGKYGLDISLFGYDRFLKET